MVLLLFAAVMTGCDKTDQTAEQHAMADGGSMHKLQMLIDDGLLMALYGANLKLDGSAEGQTLMGQGADLIRRAMSGPEMAMMHKSGHGDSAMMQRTHDLGGAAFDVIEQMMALPLSGADAVAFKQLHAVLAMAVSGNRMMLQGERQAQADQLLAYARQRLHAMHPEDSYSTLITRMVTLLVTGTTAAKSGA